MRRALTPDERQWLGYFRDLGYEELWLSGEGAGESVRPPSPSRPRKSSPAASESVVESAPMPAGAEVESTSSPATPARSDLPETYDELAAAASGCTACRLAEGRKSVVFGSGSADAELMLIGEGPGQREDEQGLPFVGPAGELLTRILAAIDRSRDEVYITNMVKCRPPRNRDPEEDEIAACRGYLDRQIDLVRPRVILVLGRVAAQALLETDRPLGRLRGEWHSVRGVSTRVTYHPAALLRNAGFRAPTWEDVQCVRDRLAESA